MAEMPEVWSQSPVPSLLPRYPSIEIARIKPSRYQARKQFDEDQIKALAESIRQEGLIEPIVVRQVGDDYELVSGERRLRACSLLGYVSIEAKVIRTISEAEAAAKGLIENLQRQDLNPIEEAEGFQALLALGDNHWTQRRLAEVVGKSESYVSQALSLLGLPSEVLENFRALKFSRSHGLEFLRLPKPKQQLKVANQVLARKLSWEATRQLVERMLGQATKTNGKQGKPKPPTDLLADVWHKLKFDGFSGAEYKGRGVWSLEFVPIGADLGKTDPGELKKELQTKLADVLIKTGQLLKNAAS